MPLNITVELSMARSSLHNCLKGRINPPRLAECFVAVHVATPLSETLFVVGEILGPLFSVSERREAIKNVRPIHVDYDWEKAVPFNDEGKIHG